MQMPIQLDSSKIKIFQLQKCRYIFKTIFNSDENVIIYFVYKFQRLDHMKRRDLNNLDCHGLHVQSIRAIVPIRLD